MSSSGTHRRDQRRRLVVSESLATVVSNPQNAGDVQRTAPYSPQADPDRQRSIASFLPVSRGPFFVACVTSIGLPAILLTAGIFFPEQSAGQFETSITAVRAMIDPGAGCPTDRVDFRNSNPRCFTRSDFHSRHAAASVGRLLRSLSGMELDGLAASRGFVECQHVMRTYRWPLSRQCHRDHFRTKRLGMVARRIGNSVGCYFALGNPSTS